jgi:hypothetical protein
MTNNPAFTANATLPKPVAESSVNFTAPSEAEERSQVKNDSKTSAKTAAASALLSATDGRTTAVPTADATSTAPPPETASPRAAASEIASLQAAYATAAVGVVPELMPTKDDTPSRTTAKKEATPQPATEMPPGELAKQATANANSKVMAQGSVEEGTSPRSRPMKRPIPTPRYVLTTVKYRFLKKKIIDFAKIILWGIGYV